MHPVRSGRSFALRTWLSIVLAAVLATTVVVAAEAPGPTLLPAAPAAASALAPTTVATTAPAVVPTEPTPAGRAFAAHREAVVVATAPTAAPTTAPKPAVTKPASATTKSKPAPAPRAPVTYSGRNHFWFPALGISQAVYSFPCDSSQAPGPQVYRWGCAGTNNVYLLAHAGGKFAPVHDAYVDHHLKAGMLAIYADSAGHVHYYKLQWVKVTAPLASSHWAWDPQPVSSLTLQTCLGAQSQWRIFVRFVEVPKP